MEHSLEALFGAIIKLSSAQRMAVLDAAAQLAADRADTQLANHVERARTHEARIRDLERERQSSGSRHALYPPAMKPLDDRLDRSLAGLRDIVHGFMSGDDNDAETQKRGAQLLAGIFPGGVAAVTNLPYRDQAVATRDILHKLANDYAAHVNFFGLTRKVANLNALSTEYSTVLENGNADVSATDVRSARRRGHQYMLEVLARVVGLAFDSDNPDHVADRERVLGVLFEQIAHTRARRNARRRRHQADPEPGAQPDAQPDTQPDTELDAAPATAAS